jgi:glucokinase
MSQKVPRKVLAYDLGGTKVAVGIVTETGEILEQLRVPVMISKGKEAVMKQLADLGKRLLKHYPEVDRVGMASAGPLHAASGVLLDPTNFKTNGKTWGKVPIVSILSKALKRPVHMENDADGAILAEHWIGAARGYKDAMILTLGTGLGTGIIIDGKLQHAGQGLHPEAGHLILKMDDTDAVCGCGNAGCAEAYLSGTGFAKRFRARAGKEHFSGEQIAKLAAAGNREAISAFREYGKILAIAIHNYTVIYAPEIVVLTGSVAASSSFFLSSARAELRNLLGKRCNSSNIMPKLVISKLQNQAGLLGGAYAAFYRTR